MTTGKRCAARKQPASVKEWAKEAEASGTYAEKKCRTCRHPRLVKACYEWAEYLAEGGTLPWTVFWRKVLVEKFKVTNIGTAALHQHVRRCMGGK